MSENPTKTPKLDVKVYPLNDQNNSTKAFASISVEDLIAIRGIRIIEGSKGLFVSMPQSKDNDGNYHDIAFPTTKELRKTIDKAIIDEYKQLTKNAEKLETAKPEKSTEKSAPKPSTDEPEI